MRDRDHRRAGLTRALMWFGNSLMEAQFATPSHLPSWGTIAWEDVRASLPSRLDRSGAERAAPC